MKLSVYLIVRDAAASLPITVKSIRDVADELVIGADDASTDGTQEVAKRLADVYYEFTWPGAFHLARNMALEKCTGDWVLSMDADESLTPQSAACLRSLLESQSPDTHLLMCYMRMWEEGRLRQQFLAEKVYRSEWRYQGAMHNYLNVPEDKRAFAPQIIIDHDRKHLSNEERARRNRQRIEMAEAHLLPKCQADLNDHRSLFYLAGTYRDAGRYEEALKWYDLYLQKSDWKEERYQAELLAAQCWNALGKRAEARQMLGKAIQENWRRNEAYMQLGEMSSEDGDVEQAKHWWKLATQFELPVDPFFVETEGYKWIPHFRLAEAAVAEQDVPAYEEHKKAAVDLGAPSHFIPHLEKGVFRPQPAPIKRLGFVVDRGQTDFIKPLRDRWMQKWEMATCEKAEDLDELLGWADTLWFEWAGPLLAEVTKREKKHRIVVRVHGYELHSGLLKQVDWTKVDEVIFTAYYQRLLGYEDCPDLQRVRDLVMHAGLDADKFLVAAGKLGNKVAMACYGNQKKGFPLALQVFAKALETRPGLELHVATEWQDSRVQLYVQALIQKLNLADHVFFHPWQKDLNAFYADKSFYLSASVEESLHVACAEAMAAGLKPVVHCWESSDDYYPLECIWRTVDEGAAMLQVAPSYSRNVENSAFAWRQWAQERLDIRVVQQKIERFLNPPRVAIAIRDDMPHRIERRLGEALLENGCMMGIADKADLILCCDPAMVESLGRPAGTKVFWSAEQLLGDDERAEGRREAAKRAAEWADVVIASTAEGAALLRGLVPGKRVETLYLGGAHPGLIPILGGERDVPVGFMGSMTPYREERIAELREQGVEVSCLSDYDPENVRRFLSRCKVSLNLHLSPEPNVETRLAESLALGCCVVSDPLPGEHPFQGNVIVADTEGMAETLKRYSADGEWRPRGERGRDWIWANLRLEQQTEKLLRMLGK